MKVTILPCIKCASTKHRNTQQSKLLCCQILGARHRLARESRASRRLILRYHNAAPVHQNYENSPCSMKLILGCGKSFTDFNDINIK